MGSRAARLGCNALRLRITAAACLMVSRASSHLRPAVAKPTAGLGGCSSEPANPMSLLSVHLTVQTTIRACKKLPCHLPPPVRAGRRSVTHSRDGSKPASCTHGPKLTTTCSTLRARRCRKAWMHHTITVGRPDHPQVPWPPPPHRPPSTAFSLLRLQWLSTGAQVGALGADGLGGWGTKRGDGLRGWPP